MGGLWKGSASKGLCPTRDHHLKRGRCASIKALLQTWIVKSAA